MQAGVTDVVSLAREESRRMEAVARQTKDGDAVSMDVRQFRHLAGMLARLCDRCEEEEDWAVGSPRRWVPLDVFETLRLRHEELQRREAPVDQDAFAALYRSGQ